MRRDGEANKLAVYNVIRQINGKRVRSPEITKLVDSKKLSDSAVKNWLRKLEKEGLIRREGSHTDPRGFVYHIVEQEG
jgi:DNA-binding MarR family transcriptional regulator